jgi:hypothetical protein
MGKPKVAKVTVKADVGPNTQMVIHLTTDSGQAYLPGGNNEELARYFRVSIYNPNDEIGSDGLPYFNLPPNGMW